MAVSAGCLFPSAAAPWRRRRLARASRLADSGWLLMELSKGTQLDFLASQRSYIVVLGTTHSFAVQ